MSFALRGLCVMGLLLPMLRANAAAPVPLQPPDGWTRSERAGAVVFTAPGVSTPDEAFLAVLPAQSPANWPASFDALWRELKHDFRDAEETPATDGQKSGHSFRIVAASMADESGRFLYVTAFAARNGQVLQPLVFVATNAALYRLHSPAMQRAFNSVQLPGTLKPSMTARPKLQSLLTRAPPTQAAGQTPPAPRARQGEKVSLVGIWSSGSVSPIGFYDASTGSWAPPSGAGQSYELRGDGTFIHAGVVQTSMYGCTTTVSVYNTGTWREDLGKLVFKQKSARTRSQDNCNQKFNYDKRATPQTETVGYRVAPGYDGQPALILATQHGEIEFSLRARP